MMISPEAFVEEYKDKSYKELLVVRDELIDAIKEFESDTEQDDQGDLLMYPLPDTQYYYNLQYLSELCKLIADKHGQESVRYAD